MSSPGRWFPAHSHAVRSRGTVGALADRYLYPRRGRAGALVGLAQLIVSLWSCSLLATPAAAVVITAPGHLRGRSVPAMPAEFGYTMETGAVRGPLRVPVDNEHGCVHLSNGALQGAVALVRRGKCTFHKKVVVLRKAGAVGMIVVNNVKGGPLFSMTDDTKDRDTLPAVLISDVSGDFLHARVEEERQLGESVHVTISLSCSTTYNHGVVHSCSSEGPSEWKSE